MPPPISTALIELLPRWPPPVLDPAGPHAGAVHLLSLGLFILAGLVVVVVLTALWVALFGKAATRRRLGGQRTIWIGGVGFPIVVLTGLLAYGLTLTGRLTAPLRGDEMRVRVTGEMWWWRVAYLDADGNVLAHDANELAIPVGQAVVIELESADVIHSFWVPRLSGKLDMIPGRTNLLRLQADAPGVFGGQCTEYCGGPHALMGFTVRALPPAAHAAHLARLARPVTTALSAEAERGARLFSSTGCGACHRIAGTDANGLAGPDLSHVGSRQSLGAGILPNNRGTLMGWIANSQAIKPGNRMPAYKMLSAAELRALAVYLETRQ